MTFEHHRRNPRLPNYDYSKAGAYFITVVTARRACLLGDAANPGKPSEAGRMVEACWRWIPSRFPDVALDCLVVMPNHIHGVLVLNQNAQFSGSILEEIMRVFKSKTTADYSRGVRERGWVPYQGHLWQRSYYDHVIRNERTLGLIRAYVGNNPLVWELDRENPAWRPTL